MFLGQASAMGTTIIIPVFIRSLSEHFFYPTSNSLSLDLGPLLVVASNPFLNDEAYSLNWWDKNTVRFLNMFGGDI